MDYKAHSIVAIALTLMLCCCTARSPINNSESEQTEELANSASGEFMAFLDQFPKKSSPAKFPTVDEEYNETGLMQIDSLLVKKYFSEDILMFGFDHPVFYHSAVEIHSDLYSVVIYQKNTSPSIAYTLVNFNAGGEVKGSTLISYFEYGTTYVNQSSAVVEGDGVRITELQLGRKSDHRIESKVEYKIHPTGVALPDGLPEEVFSTFHQAVMKKGNVLIDPICMGGDDRMTEVFKIASHNDSIFYLPYPDGHTLMAIKITKTNNTYQILFKNYTDPGDLSTSTMEFTPIEEFDGVYRLGDDEYQSYAIVEPKLSNYRTRELPCRDDRLIRSDGIWPLRLGKSSDLIADLSKEYNLYPREYFDAEEQKECKRLYDHTDNAILQVDTDEGTNTVTSMRLYTDLFATERGISVGSTLGDLLYAHENVTARCGERGVYLSAQWYDNVSFFVNTIAGPPDSEIDPYTLDQSLIISHIDFN